MGGLKYYIIGNDCEEEICQRAFQELVQKFLARINDATYNHDGGIVWLSGHGTSVSFFCSDYVPNGKKHKYDNIPEVGHPPDDGEIQLFKLKKTLERHSPDNFRYVMILDHCLGGNTPYHEKVRRLPDIDHTNNTNNSNIYAKYKPFPEYKLLDREAQELKYDTKIASYKTDNKLAHPNHFEIWMAAEPGESILDDTFTTSLTKVVRGILDEGNEEIEWNQYAQMVGLNMTSTNNLFTHRRMPFPGVSAAFVKSTSDKNGVEIVNKLQERWLENWSDYNGPGFGDSYPYGEWQIVNRRQKVSIECNKCNRDMQKFFSKQVYHGKKCYCDGHGKLIPGEQIVYHCNNHTNGSDLCKICFGNRNNNSNNSNNRNNRNRNNRNNKEPKVRAGSPNRRRKSNKLTPIGNNSNNVSVKLLPEVEYCPCMDSEVIGVHKCVFYLKDKKKHVYTAVWTGQNESESHKTIKNDIKSAIVGTQKLKNIKTFGQIKGQKGRKKQCPIKDCEAKYKTSKQMNVHVYQSGIHGYNIGEIVCEYCELLLELEGFKNNIQLQCKHAGFEAYKKHSKSNRHVEAVVKLSAAVNARYSNLSFNHSFKCKCKS